MTIIKAETADKARDDYKYVDGKRVKMTDEEFAVKLRVEAHIDEVSKVSKNFKQKIDEKNHSFANDGFTYRRAYFRDFDGKYYEVTLSIGHNGTVSTVYNVGQIKNDTLPSGKIVSTFKGSKANSVSSTNSIPNPDEKSNSFSEKSSENYSDASFALPLDEVFTAEELAEGEAKFDPEKVKKPINVGTVTSGEYAKRIADLSKKVRFDKSFVDSFVYYVVGDVSGNGVFKSLPPEVRFGLKINIYIAEGRKCSRFRELPLPRAFRKRG